MIQAQPKDSNMKNLSPPVLIFVFFFLSYIHAQEPDIRPMPIGSKIERYLKSTAPHSYSIELKKDQVLRIVIEEKGVDCNVVLTRTDEQKIVATTNFGYGYDWEIITYIPERTGSYMLEIGTSIQKPEGNYDFNAEIRESFVKADLDQIRAETLLTEGAELYGKKGTDNLWKARDTLKESMLLWKDEEKYLRANALNLLGLISDELKEREVAFDYYKQALSAISPIKAKNSEAAILNNIGKAFSGSGDKQEAIVYFEKALKLEREIGDRSDEAAMLSNIAKAYLDIGYYQKSLEYLDQSLILSEIMENTRTKATVYNSKGAIYNNLGEVEKALENYRAFLSLTEKSNEWLGQAVATNNIGFVYLGLNENQKALDHFKSALVLLEKAPDKRLEASALNNSGLVYEKFGNPDEAMRYYERSLELVKQTGDRRLEARAIGNIGGAHFLKGDNEKALESYTDALLMTRLTGDPVTEVKTLTQLMKVWNKKGNKEMAAFLGKQAINRYQQSRALIQGQDIELQKSYVRTLDSEYNKLAEILIDRNRFAEAQQVLNFSRDQGFFDRKTAPVDAYQGLVLTTKEADIAIKLEAVLQRFAEAGKLFDQFKRHIGTRQPTKDEVEKRGDLEARLKTVTGEVKDLLSKSAAEFMQTDTDAAIVNVPDLTEMQTTLREVENAVAIYTLVGKENLHLLLISSNGIKHFSKPVKAGDINRKAKEFIGMIKDVDSLTGKPKIDVTDFAREFYDILFKPIENEIGPNTFTILWNLDGNLRYIPISALHDGKDYF